MRSATLEYALQRLVDGFFVLWPRPRPSTRALQNCRIVAHRGDHDRREARENTLPAFARSIEAGVWGVEFDLRWTRDLEPVVIHDPNTRRVFGVDLVVAEVEFDELRSRVPAVPSLSEVIDRCGGRAHLMIELKQDRLDAVAAKRARLAKLLGSLRPVRDYHILALQPELFEMTDFAGEASCIAVAELNVATVSRMTLARDFAGISGQYLLLSDALLRRHAARGQQVGTGFVESRFVLYRELNRSVTWIFTNNASRLCALRRSLLEVDR